MKKLMIILAGAFYSSAVSAQTDNTFNPNTGDTLRIGNIIIVKKGNKSMKQDIYILTFNLFFGEVRCVEKA